MSANQIAISISLDAVLGSEEDHLDFINATESSAVVAFAHIDFKGTGGKTPQVGPATNLDSFEIVLSNYAQPKRRES